jgi:Uma2 family endonuclease
VSTCGRGAWAVFTAPRPGSSSREPDLLCAPDAAFVRQERVGAAGRVAGYWVGPPDLAVEVVSPNDRPTDLAAKIATWLAYGTRMVLVIYPDERRARVQRPGRRGG